MVPIVYLLKYAFQAYTPSLKVHIHGKMCYSLDDIDNFMRQGDYEYGATLFVTYMICVSLCFPGNSAMIQQALPSMESK